MKFLLHINASPESPFAEAAYNFANALVVQKQELHALFFSGLAVSTFSGDPSNVKLASNWANLLDLLSLKALCCSSASSKHIDTSSLPTFIEITGLGQLIDLSEQVDRVICFGSRES